MKKLIFALVISMGVFQVSGQDVGVTAPDFEVNLLGGETFKLSEQEGKVVFLFFFGNTCSSCKAVGGQVESSIHLAFKDDEGFVALGLDTWNSSSNENSVSAFKSFTGITFPLAVKAGDVASAYGTTYDRLLVIDRDGVLFHKGLIGASNDVNNAVEAIEEGLMTAGIFREKQESPGVRVYPHPATDVVHFESEAAVSVIRLYNAAGNLVFEEAEGMASHRRTIKLEGFERGLYFYSLQTEKGLALGKLLIQ